MDTLDQEGGVRDYNLERLIMLSDGVFAIALTLLALELRPPTGWTGTVQDLLARSGRMLFACGFFFVSIASYWISHRRNFQRLATLLIHVLAPIAVTVFAIMATRPGNGWVAAPAIAFALGGAALRRHVGKTIVKPA